MTTEMIVPAFPATSFELPIQNASRKAMPRISLLGVIAALGEGVRAARTYETLVDRGFAPADAARSAFDLDIKK